MVCEAFLLNRTWLAADGCQRFLFIFESLYYYMMESLSEFFKKYTTLTADQEKAVEKIGAFLESDNRCFLLKGYAGTGKTFLVKGMVNYVQQVLNRQPVLMAPTGRAARIISEKSGYQASTIHKAIYNLQKLDEVEVLKNGKVSYKFVYQLQNIADSIDHVYFIDEASMVPDNITETDFFVFGSGRLLSDLMEYIALNNNGRNDKVIFIGDPAQLPPVSDRVSGALNADYLKSHFDVDPVLDYELTEIVRQKDGNDILYAATYLRDSLRSNPRNSFQIPCSGENVVNLPLTDVVMKYADTVIKNNDFMSSIIINHSNKSAYDYNLEIRQKLFPSIDGLAAGDNFIINQNNYNYNPVLLNGMFARVIEVSPMPEIRSGLKSYDQKGNDITVTHKFRSVRIEVEENGKLSQLNCFILENALYSPYASLSYAENIALYIDFKIRNSHHKPKTPEFKDAIRTDKYFNALKVKFGYAVTCHKAQGGEWDTVFVNLDVKQSTLSDMFLRWTYTAITRARKTVYMFNVPEQSIFSKITFSPVDITSLVKQDIHQDLLIFELNSEILDAIENYKFNDTQKSFLKEKFIEVNARLSDTGIRIQSVIHRQYHEYYVFSKDEHSASFFLYYRNNGAFSTIQPDKPRCSNLAFQSQVLDLLEKPFNYSVIEPEADTFNDDLIDHNKLEFDENKPWLHELYLNLSSFLLLREIEIEKIEHQLFHERYFMSRNNEKACIDFWYDGTGSYTAVRPLANQCNSNKLIKDLEEIVDMLKDA